jgi:acetylornithine deacetylase/succinyl-diaminopimelate desuccinylase-like protein
MKMDQDIFTLLKALIRIQTTNGNEKDLATWITAYLSKYGINSVMQDLGNNRANLVADIGDSDGPLLLLNGHLDVVPSSNDWTYDPYGGCEERGIIYGRGAVDMKAGLAAMIASVCSLVDENLQWKGGVRLVFVADEEQNKLGIHLTQVDATYSGPSVFASLSQVAIGSWFDTYCILQQPVEQLSTGS